MALKRVAIATIVGYQVLDVEEDQTVGQILAGLEGGQQEGDVVWSEANAPANLTEPLDNDDNMILILRGLPTDLGKVVDDDEDEEDADGAKSGADDAGGDKEGAGGGTGGGAEDTPA